ncbi:crustacean hyperglycemic hormone B-like [Limulus polyphemus]|uniref:Crustacean hyperglycemic hormone B-like n=1 Tax=Limulus polyphemus TaxID=6850 RepID=A0ABM1SA94_LIMPO|nr:crustacean hyperglycemic hormone B-like [Limulus polyphemus]
MIHGRNSVLALVVVTLLTIFASGMAQTRTIQLKPFRDIGCKGEYDTSKFARLNRVCEECYNLYVAPEVVLKCRANCFKNDMFTACVDVLLLEREKSKFESFVNILLGDNERP